MKSKTASAPIVWALDPFKSSSRETARLRKTLKAWTSRDHARVMPVAVLSPAVLPWLPGPAAVHENMSRAVDQALQSRLGDRSLTTKPRVLRQSKPFLRNSIDTLLKYALRENASMIAVGTQGHSGFGHLGSFTENLIARSPIPVLTVNPQTRIGAAIRTVFLPLDFNRDSEKLFRTALNLAKARKAKLILFHQIEPIPATAYSSESIFMATNGLLAAYAEIERDRQKKGREWAEQARADGVPTEFVISRSIGPRAQAIIETAKKKDADLIVMTTRQNRAEQILLGSVTRDVLMKADRPVLVHHMS